MQTEQSNTQTDFCQKIRLMHLRLQFVSLGENSFSLSLLSAGSAGLHSTLLFFSLPNRKLIVTSIMNGISRSPFAPQFSQMIETSSLLICCCPSLLERPGDNV